MDGSVTPDSDNRVDRRLRGGMTGGWQMECDFLCWAFIALDIDWISMAPRSWLDSTNGGVGGRGESVLTLLSGSMADSGSSSSSSESASIQLFSRRLSHIGEPIGDGEGAEMCDVKDVAAVLTDCARKLMKGASAPLTASLP